MKKIFAKLLLLSGVVLLGLSQMNGQVVLFDMDFTTWSGSNPIQPGKTGITENGITFYANNSTRQYTFNSEGVSLENNYSGTNSDFILIPLTGINGSVTITVWNGTSNLRFNYKILETFSAVEDAASPSSSSSASSPATVTEENISFTNGFAAIGRQGSGYSTFSRIQITTEGVASPSISSFSVGGVDAVIDNEAETITAELPYGIGLTDLTPVVGLGGSAKSYLPAGAQDFTNPVVYGVYESEDASGVVAKSYTVTLTAATSLSSDATLSDIKVDGTTIEGFNAETFTYNIDLPLGANDIPVVSYTLSDSRASAVQHDAVSLPGSTTIVVTAEDDETTETYTINFMVGQPPLPATVLTVSETAAIDEAGWAQTENFYSVSENTIVFNAYTAYQSIETQTWIAVNGSGSTAVEWEPNGIFMGSAYYGLNSSNNDYRTATTRSDRLYAFAVANCVSASAYVKPGNSSMEVVLYAYEIQSGGSLVLTTSTSKTGSTDVAVMTISDLDETKEYVIALTTDHASTNTQFYEIAFEYPDSGSSTNIIGNTTIDNISFNGQTIFNPENVLLEVYDTTGRIVARSGEDIDMSAMKGVFIVKSLNGSLKIAVTK